MVDEKLLAALPQARLVLELGCSDKSLANMYRQRYPGASWVSLEGNFYSRANVGTRLLEPAGENFDCVVFADGLESLADPASFLQDLQAITAPEATLVCRVPNNSPALETMTQADGNANAASCILAGSPVSPPCSVRSMFKLLLDHGWLPHLQDVYPKDRTSAGEEGESAVKHIPNSRVDRMLLRCLKRNDVASAVTLARVSVIVPVTDLEQFQSNILQSPGLDEIDAEVIYIVAATSAADALRQGMERASHPWIVFCHQDVYFPKGTGRNIAAHFAAVKPEERHKLVLGFAGIALQNGALRKAGLVIDRTQLFDYPSSETATSVDEFCIGLSRDHRYHVDPDLGWHLWATDLSLQAIFHPGGPAYAQIARVPLFHNSRSGHLLPEAYHASEVLMLAKYPQLQTIMTLCSAFSQPAD